jgi:hypothetical protein
MVRSTLLASGTANMQLGFLTTPAKSLRASRQVSSAGELSLCRGRSLPPPPKLPGNRGPLSWRRPKTGTVAWIRPTATAAARSRVVAAATLARALPLTASCAAAVADTATAACARDVIVDSGISLEDASTLESAGLIVLRVSNAESIHPRRTNCSPLSPAVAMMAGAALSPLVVEVENGTRAEFAELNGTDGALSRRVERDERPFLEQLTSWLTRVYLPVGYPHTVTQDYLSYTAYRVAQNLASAIMTVLSTECLLYGLGLGANVKATAAATAWVVKDGLGYFTKVLFGSYSGGKLDSDPKSWRISADITEDIGGALEVIMPILTFPGSFIIIASFTNVLKGVAAMTGTATRHVIYRQLVAGGAENIADVATKGESQGVTCKMLGLGAGIAISSTLGQNYPALLAAYAICAVVHLSANWRSMQCVQFSFFNKQRLAIALHRAFDNRPVPTPTEVSRFEQIILPPWVGYQPHVVVGSRVRSAVSNATQFKQATALFQGEKFLITRSKHGKLHVLLRREASSVDCASAYYVVQNFLRRVDCVGSKDASRRLARISVTDYENEMKKSLSHMKRNFKPFLAACRGKGWNIAQLVLLDSSVRAVW